MQNSENAAAEPTQVVALALKNSSTGEFMLARRGPEESGAGEWEFPGGKIEALETQVEALIREIQEELSYGLVASKLSFVGQHLHQYPKRKIQIYLWSYVVDVKPEFILVDHDMVDWFSIEKIKELNLTAGDKYFISLLNSI